MHFSINLLNGDKSDMGQKLERDSGSPAFKIGMTVARLKISGKIPALKY